MKIELNGKTYEQDYVRARALKDIGPAKDAVAAIDEAEKNGMNNLSGAELQKNVETLVRWFCLFFGAQFTPDEVYDGYPTDRLLHDISVAVLATMMHVTEALKNFPLPAIRANTAAAAETSPTSQESPITNI